jgi:hypothetical protein
MKVFKELHIRGKFEKSINATFMSIIPKKSMLWTLRSSALSI